MGLDRVDESPEDAASHQSPRIDRVVDEDEVGRMMSAHVLAHLVQDDAERTRATRGARDRDRKEARPLGREIAEVGNELMPLALADERGERGIARVERTLATDEIDAVDLRREHAEPP